MSPATPIRTSYAATSVFDLFESKQVAIHRTRDDLFDRLNNISSDLSDVVSAFFYDKLRSSSTPLLGELMPWILQDICRTDEPITRQIAVGWLGLYLYSNLIDTDADHNRASPPDRVLAGMLLLTTGLTQLCDLAPTIHLQTTISSPLNHAIASQHADIHDTSPYNDLTYKAQYAAGKNHGLLALANVFAAAKASGCHLAVPFIRDLMLPLQYLDDIADWREDLHAGSYTVVLSRGIASPRLPLNDTPRWYSDNETTVFYSLMVSGALRSTLEEIQYLLSKALVSGHITGHGCRDLTPSASYLIDLSGRVDDVTLEINAAEEALRCCAQDDVPTILDQAQRSLAKLAQTT